ncbi:RNase H family protein [Thiomicrorhabdus aquaedulcis]|uniref:RNase H family protein n=1 Tax=Thiomicrorhabdus aquaedulcis TaxID=2211106 RepID=UPI001562178F|nr:RNase H family protein [Thiomicrorhabdus aquaedulcis]
MSKSPFASTPLVIEIYTDGGYFRQHQLGGWGWVMFVNQQEILRAAHAKTSHSSLEMELLAAQQALLALQTPELTALLTSLKGQATRITLYTDSRILMEGLTKKIARWRDQAWLNKSGREVVFKTLWESVESLSLHHNVHWCWVKSHNGNPGNTLADGLARQAVLKKLSV